MNVIDYIRLKTYVFLKWIVFIRMQCYDDGEDFSILTLDGPFFHKSKSAAHPFFTNNVVEEQRYSLLPSKQTGTKIYS